MAAVGAIAGPSVGYARWIRLALIGLIGAILGFACFYAVLVAEGMQAGADFTIFYAGVYGDAHGHDPFDYLQLVTVEDAVYHLHHGLSHDIVRSAVPYVNPPPYAFLMRPLAALPFTPAYWIWVSIIMAAVAAGSYAATAGWPARAHLVGTAMVTLSPVALWGVYLGQNVALVLLGLGLAIHLQARGRPGAAGLALCLGFAKPHLLLPIGLLFVAASPRRTRAPILAGMAIGLLGLLVLGLACDGGAGAYGHWVEGMRQDAAGLAAVGDVASIRGLHPSWLPAALGRWLDLACLAGAGLCGIAIWRRCGAAASWCARSFGLGVAAYFCAAPYVHTADQVILTLLLVLRIGTDADGLREARVWAAVIACAVAPVITFHNFTTPGVNLLPDLALLLAYTRLA